MGVSVVLILEDAMPGGGNSKDRFDGLTSVVHSVTLGEELETFLTEFDWEAPPKNPNRSELMSFRDRIFYYLTNHAPEPAAGVEFADILRVFDAEGIVGQ